MNSSEPRILEPRTLEPSTLEPRTSNRELNAAEQEPGARNREPGTSRNARNTERIDRRQPVQRQLPRVPAVMSYEHVSALRTDVHSGTVEVVCRHRAA